MIIREPFEVKIPVPCKVRQVECLKTGSRVDAVTELLRCNYELQQANRECR